MFIHDNGRVCVMVSTRTGHTSMTHYFGLVHTAESKHISEWCDTTSHRTMVLRNPMDRLLSAERLANNHTPRGISKREWLARHSGPYLYSLPWRWYSWSYIPFEQLQDYIPYGPKNYVTLSVADPEAQIPDYLVEEMAAYEFIKTTMPVLTPEEWRKLTG